jgi:hypothetical protein
MGSGFHRKGRDERVELLAAIREILVRSLGCIACAVGEQGEEVHIQPITGT